MSPSVRLAFQVKARQPKPQEAPQAAAKPLSTPKPTEPSRLARCLALAHHVEALIESGVLDDYADAARQLGMTRAGMCHLTNLLLLAPEIQERILTGEIDVPERRLRAVAKEPEWIAQGDSGRRRGGLGDGTRRVGRSSVTSLARPH